MIEQDKYVAAFISENCNIFSNLRELEFIQKVKN